ncbi:MAG: hypothetical protein K0U74_04040 [Alphaproteobacteria bacterium]|nr:hypothetical protein [Alphaproteobacteria bacterium]
MENKKNQNSSVKQPNAHVIGHPLKPVSPVIDGLVRPRSRIPGRELECVLTAIMDSMVILDALRKKSGTEVDLDELTQTIAVLDAAWHILANEVSNR